MVERVMLEGMPRAQAAAAVVVALLGVTSGTAYAKRPTDTHLAQGAYSTPFGSSFQISAKVTPVGPDTPIPTGTITLRDGASVVFVEPLPPDSSLVRVNLSTLEIGKRQLTAEYSGDGAYEGGTSNLVEHRVDKSNVTGMLGISPNPSVVGDTVTFSSTLSPYYGSVPPKGSVWFFDNTIKADAGSAPLDDAGAVTMQAPPASVGSHLIVMIYSGDDHYIGGGVNGYTQIVTAPDASVAPDASIVDAALDVATPPIQDAGTSETSNAPPAATPSSPPSSSASPADGISVSGGGCDCRASGTSPIGSSALALLAVGLFVRRRVRPG